jgi:hypothetical protein
MTTGPAREFFLASAGVAGALIGLLFVAISVAPERVLGPEASETHAVRAAASLTAFSNALTVSLFALVPGLHAGGATTAVAIVGLLFIAGSLVRFVPLWRARRAQLRDLSFLVGLLAVFVVQLIAGIGLDSDAHDSSDLQTVCILVVVCFLIGIARAWELVGGPNVNLTSQLLARARSRGTLERPAEHEQDDSGR